MEREKEQNRMQSQYIVLSSDNGKKKKNVDLADVQVTNCYEQNLYLFLVKEPINYSTCNHAIKTVLDNNKNVKNQRGK